MSVEGKSVPDVGETGAADVAMTSVAGSDGLSILVVTPASKPEGAVNRRSGSSGEAGS